MRPILPSPAVADSEVEPRIGSVVGPPPAVVPAERRHFVFGLFDEVAKAEHALRKLRAAHFEDGHVLLVGGAAGNGNRTGAVWDKLPAGGPFGSLASLLLLKPDPDAAAPAPHDGLAPRIAHQITNTLDRDGAVLIVAIQTAEQERGAARTLLTCKCDVLLTHEMAIRT